MTEKQLLAVVQEAERQWSILDVLVIHRVGDVFLDDVLVHISLIRLAAVFDKPVLQQRGQIPQI
jgi:molybdopterin synthase catalytic subunit